MDIIRFKGGLGNQMFQYALMEALRNRGRHVECSLGYYRKHPDKMQFRLTNAFETIDLPEVEDAIFNSLDEQWKKIKCDPQKLAEYMENPKDIFFYVEQADGQYDERVFATENCVFVGYWQTEEYFKDIRTTLLKRFQFNAGEKKLEEYGQRLTQNYFSVHVRRGDYLKASEIYGGICTKEYYQNAINYVNSRIEKVEFIFFSDDIEWVKRNFGYISDAVFFDQNEFQNYQDWYDMYLMTKCCGNIIANSSFSWWGAWLNQNPGKIVIAPEKWLNTECMADICPKDWVRLDS